jgi:uncharacterized membrane protein YcaP (DUF421 family)
VFHVGTPLWEIALRTTIVYLVILVGLRLFGKRQLGQVSVGDLVMILLIANAVQNAMVGVDVSLIGGLTAALVLLVLNFLVVRGFGSTPLGERVLEGSPTLLVKDGRIMDAGLRREGLAARRSRWPSASTGSPTSRGCERRTSNQTGRSA